MHSLFSGGLRLVPVLACTSRTRLLGYQESTAPLSATFRDGILIKRDKKKGSFVVDTHSLFFKWKAFFNGCLVYTPDWVMIIFHLDHTFFRSVRMKLKVGDLRIEACRG